LSAAIDYKLALSFKIENAFTTAAQSYGALFGWEATVYPAESALIVNVPTAEDGTHYQYVMNTITKAWCRFKGWEAEAFCVFNKALYYTVGTNVHKAWTTRADAGTNIDAFAQQAFSYLGSSGQSKQVKMFRPVIVTTGSVAYLTGIDVDFATGSLLGSVSYTAPSGSTWGTAVWGTAVWSGGQTVVKKWTGPASYPGRAISPKVRVITNSVTVQWVASDLIYERGAAL